MTFLRFNRDRAADPTCSVRAVYNLRCLAIYLYRFRVMKTNNTRTSIIATWDRIHVRTRRCAGLANCLQQAILKPKRSQTHFRRLQQFL